MSKSRWVIAVGMLALVTWCVHSRIAGDAATVSESPSTPVAGRAFLAADDSAELPRNEVYRNGLEAPAADPPAGDSVLAQDRTNPGRLGRFATVNGGGLELAAAESSSGRPRSADGAPVHGVRADIPEEVPTDSRFVSWTELGSFWYEGPAPELVLGASPPDPMEGIPEPVKALHGQRVTVRGFIEAIDVRRGRVQMFLVQRMAPGCCFTDWPELTDWVEARLPEGEGLEFIPYGTALVTGQIEVGAEFDEYGYVRSLYRMEADEVSEEMR